MVRTICFKASETLLGIETCLAVLVQDQEYCFKASETLLGIETEWFAINPESIQLASKPLKPF